MNFVKRVQNSEIKQPTQNDFSLSNWTEEYEKSDKSDEETKLFLAGLFYYKKFQEIRNELQAISIIKKSKEKLVRLYVGLVNRNMKVLLKKQKESLEQISEKGHITASEMVEVRLETPIPGHSIQAEQMVQGIVTGLKYPLYEVFKFYEKLPLKKPESKDEAKELTRNLVKKLDYGILYNSYEIFWLESLWHKWSVQSDNNLDYAIPPATNEYNASVIGEHRFSALQIEHQYSCENIWKKIPSELKKEVCTSTSFVKVEKSRGKIKYHIGEIDLSSPNIGWVNSIKVREQYFEKLSKIEIKKFNSANIQDFLIVYEHLFHLAKAITKMVPADLVTGSPHQVLEFSPLINYKEVSKKICEISNIQIEKVNSILKTLSFSGNIRNDIWLKPLVKLNDNYFCPVLPALTFPNLIRSVEYWFAIGGLKIHEKGEEFEQYIRKNLFEETQKSKVLNKSFVYNKSLELKVGKEYEEIDLVWIIDNKIFIGESKCIFHAAEPIEWRNFTDVVIDAVKQAKRKAKFVETHFDKFIETLKLDSSTFEKEISFHPLVVLSKPLMSGFELMKVPITDINILSSFCQGFYLKIKTSSKAEEKEKVHYYENWKSAVQNIENYLKTPPILQGYKDMLEEGLHEYPPMTRSGRLFKSKGLRVVP